MAELNLRTSAQNAIKKYHERISTSKLDLCDSTELEQNLKSIGGHFKRFVVNHEALVSNAKGDELESHGDLWEIVEKNYNETCVLLNRQLSKISSKAIESSSTSNGFDIKLDPVVIPTFDGCLHNWLAFKDIFKTLVHDAKLPEAYKLAKLRQAVDPVKVPLIGSMYSGGYAEVWKSLTSRFDNKKLLAEIHVSRFLNMKPAPDESAKSLLSIVDTVQESFRALRVMELQVDAWDALSVPIVVSKLPIATQKEWNMASVSDKIPILVDLLKFLEKRAHSLTTEQIRNPSRQQHSHQPMKMYLATVDDEKCVQCQGNHKISRCHQFLALKPDQRFEALKQSNMCFNCLKQGHSYRQCPSGVCRHCGRKHHTILCQQLPAQAVDLPSSATFTQSNGEPTLNFRRPSSSSQSLGQGQL